MIQKQSTLTILDNSGGVLGRCIGLYKNKKIALTGEVVKLSIKKIRKDEKSLKKGELSKALIVQTRNSNRRGSGIWFSFNLNGGILVSDEGKPVGTKIRSLVPKELRRQGFLRAASISKGLI